MDAKEYRDLATKYHAFDERVWPELILFSNENFQKDSDSPKQRDASHWKETRFGGELSFDGMFNFLKCKYLHVNY